MNVDDVKRLIEEVAYDGSRVDTVLVCVNAQVMYYPTKVGTMRGTLSTPEERAKWPASEKQRFDNLKAFFDKGVDPYAVMLAEAKRRGREALLTFRMNDDHGNDFLRTQFLVDHPDWRLGTEQYRGKGAMDFGRDEVRDYTFRLIEEAVRRYDCDGIELDFNRFPTFFKDGTTDERVAKMNSLVERVRKMLDDVGRERGRRLVLAVRVPSNYGRTPPTPETARQLGCDVPAWVKHGWVDFVAVSEFLFERGDLPIDQWKQAITTVPVYGGIECTQGGGQKNLTADEYRLAATKLIKAGADGVYLFNFFTSREEGEKAYEPPFEVLRELGAHDGGSPAGHAAPFCDTLKRYDSAFFSLPAGRSSRMKQKRFIDTGCVQSTTGRVRSIRSSRQWSLAICAWLAACATPVAPPARAAELPDEKAEFLRLCDLAVVELNKEITPFLNHGDADPQTHHVPFFEDSYAVRALAVAYDMTGKNEYLAACQHWCDRVLDYQAQMIPKGAYYLNYGRRPGEDQGDWWVADSGSVGMGVLATAVRTRDPAVKQKYLDSLRAIRSAGDRQLCHGGRRHHRRDLVSTQRPVVVLNRNLRFPAVPVGRRNG